MHCKVRRAGALQTTHTPDLGGRTRVTIFVTPTANVEKPLTPTHLSYIYTSKSEHIEKISFVKKLFQISI